MQECKGTIMGILERLRGLSREEQKLRGKQSELKKEINTLNKQLDDILDAMFK